MNVTQNKYTNTKGETTMWYRRDLKDNAKVLLRANYWKCFLVSFLLVLLGGTSSGGTNMNFRLSSNRGSGIKLGPYTAYAEWLIWIMGFIVLIVIVMLALRIFVGYCFEIGARKYYIKASEDKENVNLNNMSYGFKNGYWGIIGTMIWKDIALFLWTLLLIIPGIIKSYAYRMVPYILADNPEIGASRALELSNEMTKGHKLDMWVLDLSFLGWYLLGLLALFVGVFFVHPYVDATNAELYLVLRKQAVANGMCSESELNLGTVIEDDLGNSYRTW